MNRHPLANFASDAGLRGLCNMSNSMNVNVSWREKLQSDEMKKTLSDDEMNLRAAVALNRNLYNKGMISDKVMLGIENEMKKRLANICKA